MPYRQITHSLALSLFTALLLMQVSGTAAARTLKPIAQTASVSTIQRIRDRGNVLVAGVMYDFPPFGYEDDGGNLVGFDIELIRAIANSWGVQVEFVPLNADDRIPLLVAGEVDIVAAAMTHTQYRDEEIDFSQTYFLDGQGLLVRSDAEITTLAELQNKRVAAIQGTTSLPQIAAVTEMQAIDIEIVPFLEHAPALDALESGTVEAFTTDLTTLSLFAERNPAFRVVGAPLSVEPYGFGIQSGDTAFRHLINSTLQELKTNGTYDALYAEWFPTLSSYKIAPLPRSWPYSFTTSPTILEIPVRSTVDKLLQRNQLIVGVNGDAPPFSTLLEDGTCCTGFEIDLLQEFAARWLRDEEQVEFVSVTAVDGIAQLQAGTLDFLTASINISESGDIIFDYSLPYYANPDPNAAQSLSVLTLPAYDAKLLNLINFTLQAMATDGTFAQIYTKWFPGDDVYHIEPWPGLPTDSMLLSLIEQKPLSTAEQETIGVMVQMPSTVTLVPSPTATVTPVTATPVSPSQPAMLPRTEHTPTALPTSTVVSDVSTQVLIPTDFEGAESTTALAPITLPSTGVSRVHLHTILVVMLMITILFGSAIFRKQPRHDE